MTTLLVLLQDAAQGQGGWSGIIMIVALIAIFYFMMIRPQQKKQKEIRKFRDALKVGDKVISAGGIYGRIEAIKENYIVLEISKGVSIRIDKGSIYAAPQDASEANEALNQGKL